MEKTKYSEDSSTEEMDFQIVYFKLETTGFSPNANILRITMISGNKLFERYITPGLPIPEEISVKNGITYNGRDMFYCGEKVQHFPADSVLKIVLSYLKKFSKPCVLFGYNCLRFHAPKLVRLIQKENLTSEFSEVIHGFSGDLKLFKDKFPGRNSYKFENLLVEILKKPKNDVLSGVAYLVRLRELAEKIFFKKRFVEKFQTF